MTKDTLRQLEEAFAMGCPDIEACLYAGISTQSLYVYQQEHPEFADRKRELKEQPVLLARTTVIKSLDQDVNSAWRYLERKDKELNPKSQTDITSGGERIALDGNVAALAAKAAELLKEQKT